MMIIDIILVSLGLIGSLIASISDIKIREVPDWLNYALIFSGFSLRLMQSISSSKWSYFLYSILGFVLMFLLGTLLYYTKQWGGGDTKLLMALGVIFSTRPYFIKTEIPFLILMLINILIFGALYGFIYGITLAARNKKSFVKEFKILNQDKKMKKLKMHLLCLVGIIFVINLFIMKSLTTKLMISYMLIPILLYPYLIMFVRSVENSSMYKMTPVRRLTEGDWVEQDVKIKGKIIYHKKGLGIEKKDIQRLIKANVKQVLVKQGIPFVPPIFIGILFSLIIGKVIFLPALP